MIEPTVAVTAAPPAVDVGTTRRNLSRVLNASAMTALASLGLDLAVIPFLLRTLTLRRYGEWATLAALLAVVQLADAGIATDIARRVAAAQGRGNAPEARLAVQRGLTVLLALALGMVAVAAATAWPVLAMLFPGESGSGMGALLAVYVSAVVLLGVGLVVGGWLAALGGLQRSDLSAWGALASLVAGTAVTAACAAGGLGLWALLAGTATQQVVAWVPPALGLRRLRPDIRLRPARVGVRTALGYIGMPAMIVMVSIGNLFQYQIDKLVLSHYRGPSVAGLYQIGLNLVLQVQVMALLPLGVLLAATAELHATQPLKLWRVERLATCAALSIGATLIVGVELFASPFIHMWLGPGYETTVYVARMLGPAVLIGVVGAPWYYYAVGRGLYGYILVGAGTNLLVNATCTIVLTPRIGVSGALAGSLSGNVIALLVSWSLLRRRQKRPWLSPAVRPLAAVAAAGTAAFLVSSWWPPLSWIAFVGQGALYLCLAGVCLLAVRAVPLRVRRRGWLPVAAFDEEALA